MSKKEKEILENVDTEETVETEETAEAQETAETSEEAVAEGEEAAETEASPQDIFDEKLKELNDKVLRQAAEFQNYRTRTEKEKAAMFDTGVKTTIEKLLPIVDNFERGLVGKEEGEDPFVDGMLLTYRQMQTMLSDMGITPIEALGCEFNQDLHNAIQHVDDETKGENEVVQELQKGYMYKDAVLRHSLVIVAN